MTARLERLRRQALGAALLLGPLVFWPWSRDAYHYPKLAVLSACAAVSFAAWWWLGRPGWSAVPRWFRLVAGGCLAWVAVRAVGAEDRVSAWTRTGEWVLSLALAASALGLPAESRRRAIWMLLAGGAAASLAGLGQQLFGRQFLSPYAVDPRSITFTEERVFSTFGNPLFFAGYLVLVLPLAAAVAREAWRAGARRAAGWSLAAAVLMVGSLAMTASRSAFLALGASVAILLLTTREPRGWVAGAAAAAAAIAAAAGLWKPGLLEHLAVFGDPGRLQMWRTAWRLWAGAPFTGVGTGQFTRLYPCAQLEAAGPGESGFGLNAVHAHNDYLEAAAELGVPGAVLVAGTFLGPLAWPGAGLAVWAVRAGVVAVAAHALFNFPLQTMPVMAFVWLLPAVHLAAPAAPTAAPGRLRPIPAAALAILGLAAASAGAHPLVRSAYVQWGLAYHDAAREAVERNPPAARELALRSARSFEAALALGRDDAHARIGFHLGRMWFEVGNLDAAQARFEADLDAFPCYPEGFGNLGVVHGVRAMRGEGRAHLERAQELILSALRRRPGGREAASDWNSLGNLRVLAGNERGAVAAYREALRLDPALAEAAFNAAELLWRSGRRAEARALVGQALAAKPGDPALQALAARWQGGSR